ncbi:MAPEG family protein [uncultured Jannaschia sp.]|uniref:MAPEG family protein n=1 Tax=uncultured Jannaschia sp. TaxID=293347 RepID=UPI00261945E9|nr:MAPEG family protein [uncultured Jannaschia sp.]
MGTREGIAPPTNAAGRAKRAHLNLLENAVPFALVVLSAEVIEATSGVTQTAALVFIVPRAVHAIFYVAGIPGIRTLAWLVGVVATIVIAIAIVA